MEYCQNIFDFDSSRVFLIYCNGCCSIMSTRNYSLGFRDIRYKVAINLVRLEVMSFLVTNKRYRNHVKNVRQRFLVIVANG
jgi:hypothetical protein